MHLTFDGLLHSGLSREWMAAGATPPAGQRAGPLPVTGPPHSGRPWAGGQWDLQRHSVVSLCTAACDPGSFQTLCLSGLSLAFCVCSVGSSHSLGDLTVPLKPFLGPPPCVTKGGTCGSRHLCAAR